jgi:branched-chain amino acid transport system substrate-binding protein
MLFSFDFIKKDEVKFGFVAALSGKYSYLGHDVLNGIKLALDEVDYKINDKLIHLIEKDDQQNKDKALEIIKGFQKDNIPIVFGNTTSSMAKISINSIKDNNKILLISSTASSSEFTNIDDNFIRTQVAHSTKGFNVLSKHLFKNDIKSLVLVYDSKNKIYSNNYLINFQESFINNGGKKFIKTIDINTNFKTIAKNIQEVDVDGIVIVANSIDSSKLIQFLRVNKIDKRVIITGWAKTKEFLQNGGKRVNDVILTASYDDESNSSLYLDFKKRYFDKYKTKPSIFSAQAYETAKIILSIIQENQQVEFLKQNIIDKKVFDGLQGKIVFNKYGDVFRENFLFEIKNGKYLKIDE